MNRGILSTIYVRGTKGKSAEDLHAILLKYYAKEPFVHVLPFGQTPQTRHVRGSNMTFIGVAKDRVPGRAIVISALDNLVKGASGQAVQNMNLMLGYPETTGAGAGGAVSVGPRRRAFRGGPNGGEPGIRAAHRRHAALHYRARTLSRAFRNDGGRSVRSTSQWNVDNPSTSPGGRP